MRRPIRALAAGTCLAAAASLTLPARAAAAFNDVAVAGASYTSGVLAPPTSPSATGGSCSTVTGDRIVLTWTATPTAWASGYEIARRTASADAYTVIATVAGRTTTTYTDGPLFFSTTYHYAIRSTRHGWRSTDAIVSRTTRSAFCL